MTTARISHKSEGNQRKLNVTSAYLPYDLDEPPPANESADMTTAVAGRSNSSLAVMPTHTMFYGGATASTQEKKSLMEYLVNLNLNILNHGNKYTLQYATEGRLQN